MSVYYKVKKTSETGIKFQKMCDKKDIAFEEAKAFANKYGFRSWRGAYWTAFGGISSCVNFETEPDKKIWGKGAVKGEFMPKKNTKVGKAINKEIDELTKVSSNELNECVGFDGAPFKTIGFNQNEEYFSFSVGEDWDFTPPSDCEEILTSEYHQLFK